MGLRINLARMCPKKGESPALALVRFAGLEAITRVGGPVQRCHVGISSCPLSRIRHLFYEVTKSSTHSPDWIPTLTASKAHQRALRGEVCRASAAHALLAQGGRDEIGYGYGSTGWPMVKQHNVGLAMP